jgi:hypothetical protein
MVTHATKDAKLHQETLRAAVPTVGWLVAYAKVQPEVLSALYGLLLEAVRDQRKDCVDAVVAAVPVGIIVAAMQQTIDDELRYNAMGVCYFVSDARHDVLRQFKAVEGLADSVEAAANSDWAMPLMKSQAPLVVAQLRRK